MKRTPEQLIRHAEAQARYRSHHPERVAEQQKAWYDAHEVTPEDRAKSVIATTKYRNAHPEYVQRQYDAKSIAKDRIRNEIFDILGHECRHCGFDDPRALQIDHVDGGGYIDRVKRPASGQTYYGRILFDPDIKTKFQILCANCNWIKRFENNEHSYRDFNKTKLVTGGDPILPGPNPS